MNENQFIPKMKVKAASEINDFEEVRDEGEKPRSAKLLKFAQSVVVSMFFLVPIFFTPGLFASLGFDKTTVSIVLGFLVVVLLSFLALRTRQARSVVPVSLGLYWSVVVAALVSAVMSGDSTDAIFGSAFEVQTVGFLAVLGMVMTVVLVLQKSKKMTLLALTSFGVVSTFLLLYNLVRLIFDASILSFGNSFSTVTTSPLGTFSDLSLLSGLLIVLAFITLIQLPLRAVLQYCLVAVIFASLMILSVVNFISIWIVVGLFSLFVLLYMITKDTLFGESKNKMSPAKTRLLIVASAIVCAVSALFVVAGDYASEQVSSIVNVEYVQVLPSRSATLDIIKSVYAKDMILGVGPNRFADAWSVYKEKNINETIFWDTDFATGSGFIPTLFITLGLLGGSLFLIFHLWFLYLGYKILLRSNNADSYWYYLGSVSFAGATFIWGMSYVYKPEAAMLLIGALFTGLTFVAAGSLLPQMIRTIPLLVTRQRGFFLMALVIIIIPMVILSLFSVSKQYIAQSNFNKANSSGQSVEVIEQVALESYLLFPDDRFVRERAQIHLLRLNQIINTENPTKEDENRFLSEAEQAKLYIDQAISTDPTNPDNYAILAGIYGSLAIAGIGEAQGRAEASLVAAQKLDPLNPVYNVISAQMSARIGDVDSAKEELDKALDLKSNFTEALFLYAQIDISEGNIESAISTTRAIISLEPRNPTRYFQLGMLLAADENYIEASEYFKAAITLDPQYSNARYLLALTYLSMEQKESALEQLDMLDETNPNEPQVQALRQQINNDDDFVSPDLGLETPLIDVPVIDEMTGDNLSIIGADSEGEYVPTPTPEVEVEEETNLEDTE